MQLLRMNYAISRIFVAIYINDMDVYDRWKLELEMGSRNSKIMIELTSAWQLLDKSRNKHQSIY